MKTTDKSLSRREFIRLGSMSGAALTLGLYFPSQARGAEAEVLTGATADARGISLNAWVTIDTSGKVTIMNHRSEMGQGAYQVVPQMVAEELEVNLDQVNIVFAPGNGKVYGSQITGGSSTVRGAYKQLMRVGASAREMLLEAAAKKNGWMRNELYAENGFVIHRPSGKKTGYGELVEEASRLQPPTSVVLKNPADYKVIRKPLRRQDIPLKVNGQAIFGIDKKLPGLLYAVVERSPRWHGKVARFDDSASRKIAGVKQVVQVEMDVFGFKRQGVAVLADNVWAAMEGRKVLKVEWDDAGIEPVSTDQLFTRMREDLKKPGNQQRALGNAAGTYEKAEKKIEAIYETPYEAHACLEPVNCTAWVHDGVCEVWGPIQAPDWVQGDLSQKLGMSPEKITVNMTFLGGGFGRKAFTDFPQEAAVLSKAAQAPVQVIWTREDDLTQGPFRPGNVYACRASLSKNGKITSFSGKMAAQNFNLQYPFADKAQYNDSTTEGLLEAYFETLPHYHFSDVPTESPVPTMWWRSVYASTNCFAYESFLDELSLEAGQDPVDFRRNHLQQERYLALLDKLEEVSGWKKRGKNEGWGVAVTECFKSIVGEVVKVSKKPDGKIKIDKVIAVMDCGWYVNPDIIRQQVEGSIIMALGAATKHASQFADGKASIRNFDAYKMPRLADTPEIEIHIVDNDERPGGVGEPGLPPLAPALTNAIFDLTGKRIRKLPFNLDEV